MTAGVPGAGISAFFYLIAVLAMPFVAAWRAARARSIAAGRWSLVGRQMIVATGIALGLVAGTVLITLLLTSLDPGATGQQTAQAAWQVGSALSRVGVGLALLTLAAVVGTVQVAAIIDGWRSRRFRPARRPPHKLEPLWSPAESEPRRTAAQREG